MTWTHAMPAKKQHSGDETRVELTSPTALPKACSFLWNPRMLLQVNCRGFVTAQHMQPEATKYSHAPVLEQRTFMQPEQQHYAHHPGRFFYLRDEATNELWSLPHEPVRRPADAWLFSAGRGDIEWRVSQLGVDARVTVSVPADDVVELWEVELVNTSDRRRALRLCTCFSIGYMSWMNQAAGFDAKLEAIVATSVLPYQRLEDYPKALAAKSMTFLAANRPPNSYEASLEAFEGEGGLHDPDGLRGTSLGNGEAHYEIPVAAMQYAIDLRPGEATDLCFIFGPARDRAEIAELRKRYLLAGAFAAQRDDYARFLEKGRACLTISTPDTQLDGFVNHWLGRQVHYLGGTHRMTTDPQTRNYLQDSIGMAYVDPAVTRRNLLLALGQQRADGSMPDGIVLVEGVDLTYINQVPHADHAVWLPVCLEAYLDESADYALLGEPVAGVADGATRTVFDRVTAAMRWLIANCDERGLSLIAQGDWCDPMNMVGHLGKGVSGWLTIATVHALRLWADTCDEVGRNDVAQEMRDPADLMAEAAQRHLWDGRWFARGISDNGTRFGVSTDTEGRIYLNPQSWAMLAGIASEEQVDTMITAIEELLGTPYGTAMLAPAYTSMVEHIGRLTQKHPGVGENGSIYNHAALFYVFALLRRGDADRAFDQVRRMIPDPDAPDFARRGQLSAFVPTYYRGDTERLPQTAGRSSQLFNTGAASWLYRCLVEGVFGLRGCRDGLRIEPHLPSGWDEAKVVRRFRGATYEVSYRRTTGIRGVQVKADGCAVDDGLVPQSEAGTVVEIEVSLPAVS
jgi:cellobionic acid phosphorylase